MVNSNIIIEDRINIAKIYKELNPGDNIAAIAKKLREDMETVVLNWYISVNDRLDKIYIYKEFATDDDIATIARKLRPAINAGVVNSNTETKYRLHLVGIYNEFASDKKDVAAIAKKLRPAIEAMMENSNISINERISTLMTYKRITPEDADAVMNRLRENIELMISSSHISMRDRLKTAKTYLVMLDDENYVKALKFILPVLEEESFKDPQLLQEYFHLYDDRIAVEHPGRIKQRLIAAGFDLPGYLDDIPDPPPQVRAELSDFYPE